MAIEGQAKRQHKCIDHGFTGEAPETIQDLTAGCKILASKENVEPHKNMAGIVYLNM